MMKKFHLLVGIGFLFSTAVVVGALAAEPPYCNPMSFKKLEISPGVRGYLKRLHVFKVGKVTMAGLAVGDSNARDTAHLAETYNATSGTNYCTWYLNKGNRDAERIFNHSYVENPLRLDPAEATSEYREVLGTTFTDAKFNFLSCMENGYVALGCNGQQHRGPSVFGMLLAYSGCVPRNAMEIANQIWGLNSVDPRVRMAIVEVGYDLGNKNPERRQRMQDLLLGQ